MGMGEEMGAFEGLGIDERLAAAIGRQGIAEPTEIQRQAIPRILAGRSIVGEAPTGTGKTLAYLLPVMQMLDENIRQVQAVILAPTYELGMQVARTAGSLAGEAGLSIGVQGIIGAANIRRQIENLKKKPQMIAGSAGRMLELARGGKLKLHQARFVVLDEFDRLLDGQNLSTTRELLRILPNEPAPLFLLFSATAPQRAIDRMDFASPPEILRVGGVAESGLREDFCCIVPFRGKLSKLRKLSRRLPIRRGLVFVNRSFDVGRALSRLRYEGIRAGALVGSLGKEERSKSIADFAGGRIQLMLATDLAARGLDIRDIDYVVNLDLPEDESAYLHRAGRTARAGAAGRVITLADPGEVHRLEEMERRLGISIRSID